MALTITLSDGISNEDSTSCNWSFWTMGKTVASIPTNVTAQPIPNSAPPMVLRTFIALILSLSIIRKYFVVRRRFSSPFGRKIRADAESF